MTVPFLDLSIQYALIKDEIEKALQKVFQSGRFASGPCVEDFEKAFASFCQSDYAVAVSSGTEALWMTLMCLGVGEEDDVITTPNSFIATAEAIKMCGAKPVFVDIDEYTYTMNPDLLESSITPRTKALIPVHLFGQMSNMDPIMKVAKAHNLFVIEDACQAHGAEYKGLRAGSIGHAGCFSFYPGKNLGGFGEGGAVVTNDATFVERMKMFRDHGQRKKNYHTISGWNARMDELQAAVLSVKLKYLSAWNEARIRNAAMYTELLAGENDILLPREAEYARHVYHIYAVRLKNRNALMDRFEEKHISCKIHYPVPIHLQEAFSFLGYHDGSFPVAEKCAKEIVSLPMFPELSSDQINTVASEIKYFLRRSFSPVNLGRISDTTISRRR
jgi:dTDP-4-amino-4,6-dideoxygalactose transaminase